MIKAETITHEAMPAPNWLDHCRTLVTPGRSIILVLVVMAGVLGGLLIRENDTPGSVGNTPATTQSQQSDTTALPALKVEPLQQLNQATPPVSPEIQPTSPTPQASAKTASPATAKASTTRSSNAASPIQSDGKQLNLESTTQKLNDTVRPVVNAVPLVRQLGL